MAESSEMNDSGAKGNDRGETADGSRRGFLRKAGAVLFSVTIVDVADPGAAMAQGTGCGTSGQPIDAVCQPLVPPLQGHDPDGNCGAGSADEACQNNLLVTDPDNNCGGASATPGQVDPDDGCSAGGGGSVYDPDSSCNQNTGNPVGPLGGAEDESCGHINGNWIEADENCGITGPVNPSHDPDASCTAGTVNEADQACGDCDDNHDSDEHCGQSMGPGLVDTDELCGHAHVVRGDADDNCTLYQVADSGCGTHNTVYSPPWGDTDESCNQQQVDQNCSTQASDATCGLNNPPYSSSPDEQCGSTDTDEACGHYDQDQSCTPVANPDESCGVYTIGGVPFVDIDGLGFS